MNGDVIYARQAEPLDALLWRETGRGSGSVEAALAANPGLARTGEALADRTPVIVPQAAQSARETPLVQLWD